MVEIIPPGQGSANDHLLKPELTTLTLNPPPEVPRGYEKVATNAEQNAAHLANIAADKIDGALKKQNDPDRGENALVSYDQAVGKEISLGSTASQIVFNTQLNKRCTDDHVFTDPEFAKAWASDKAAHSDDRQQLGTLVRETAQNIVDGVNKKQPGEALNTLYQAVGASYRRHANDDPNFTADFSVKLQAELKKTPGVMDTLGKAMTEGK